MKPLFPLFILIAFCLKVKSQEVEKSIFGIQIGYPGIWVHNEYKLASQIVIRSEVGIEGYNNFDKPFMADYYIKSNFIIEPRYYYRLNHRSLKSKNIDKNSSDFFALKTYYSPNIYISDDESRGNHLIAIMGKWGLKRTVYEHLTYEFGFGFGFGYISKSDYYSKFLKLQVTQEAKFIPALDLHLRIGYTF